MNSRILLRGRDRPSVCLSVRPLHTNWVAEKCTQATILKQIRKQIARTHLMSLLDLFHPQETFYGTYHRLTFFVLKDVWMLDGDDEAHVAIRVFTVERKEKNGRLTNATFELMIKRVYIWLKQLQMDFILSIEFLCIFYVHGTTVPANHWEIWRGNWKGKGCHVWTEKSPLISDGLSDEVGARAQSTYLVLFPISRYRKSWKEC